MELDTSGIKNELICIEYPGIVKDVDKMLDTLGGLPSITKVLQLKNRRLELRFRPNDPYCKPVCGDKIKTNTLLLRIKVSILKSKTTGVTQAAGSVSVIGRVTTSIKFRALCDFQYLPLAIGEKGEMLDLSKEMLPQSVAESGLDDWLSKPISLHLPPPVFARVDNPGQSAYHYRSSGNDAEKDCKVIGRTRSRRSGHALFVSFHVDKVPQRPKEKALKYIQIKMLDKQYNLVKQMFKERPVWSKLALMCETKLTHDSLKFVLPATAYYFINGPFRIMWVKFGYDPRKCPEAKIYQTLDFRMRSLAGLANKIKAKRNYTNCILPNKSSHSSKPKDINVTLSAKELDENESSSVTKFPKLKGDEYIFDVNTIPHTRQMFYQYVDLRVAEIKTLFAQLPEDSPDTVCDARSGFLPRGFDVHCRHLILDYVTKSLNKVAEEAKVEGIGEELKVGEGASTSASLLQVDDADENNDDEDDEEEDEVEDSWQVDNVDEDDDLIISDEDEDSS